METGFVACDSRGLRCAEEGGEGWFGGVDALDLVYVCGVYGGGEGAEEELGWREGGGDGVGMEAVGSVSTELQNQEEGDKHTRGPQQDSHILNTPMLLLVYIHMVLISIVCKPLEGI